VTGLSPEQEDRIRLLLADELRAAWDAARATGAAPAALAEIIEQRRRELGSAPALVEDVEDRGDDTVGDRRVGE
jgi:hypothetical protein